MKKMFSTGFLVMLCCGIAAGTESREDRESAKANEWEKSALHREWAASIADEEAQSFLDRAAVLRRQAYTEEDRPAFYREAGQLEKSAGDMLTRALSNLDAAVQAWRNVAREHRRSSEQEKEARALAIAREVYRRAREVCRRIAQAYEKAADIVADELTAARSD